MFSGCRRGDHGRFEEVVADILLVRDHFRIGGVRAFGDLHIVYADLRKIRLDPHAAVGQRATDAVQKLARQHFVAVNILEHPVVRDAHFDMHFAVNA